MGELEGALDSEIGWELEIEIEVEVAVAVEAEVEVTAVSLVALAPVHLLVDPGVFGLEVVEIHAGCLEELSGG